MGVFQLHRQSYAVANGRLIVLLKPRFRQEQALDRHGVLSFGAHVVLNNRLVARGNC
jgi:hypothetical protein